MTVIFRYDSDWGLYASINYGFSGEEAYAGVGGGGGQGREEKDGGGGGGGRLIGLLPFATQPIALEERHGPANFRRKPHFRFVLSSLISHKISGQFLQRVSFDDRYTDSNFVRRRPALLWSCRSGDFFFFVTSKRYVARLLIETRSANVVHCSDGFGWCLTLVFV